MGTPEFAVASLDILVKNNYDVAAVVTVPDKPAGRGQKISESAVKQYAVANNLPVLQPEKLKSEEFINALKEINADLFIVVAFRMLPEVVWTMPKLGTFNLHGSLLPQYRGAAPLNWAVINGEKYTGVTTFFLKHEIDTGSIIFQEKIEISDDMNVGELHDKAMLVGANLVLKTVQAIESDNIRSIDQNEWMTQNNLKKEELKHAPKIFKEDREINWNNTADSVVNLVRGLSPYPVAFTTLNHQMLKIYSAKVIEQSSNLAIGEFESDGKTYLRFKAADHLVQVEDLQLEGKKRMKVEELLRGYRI
jgi:methionyl-tRNA formyltransferase